VKRRDFQMTQEVVTIENKTGIHARPASIFVQTATKFKSKVQIQAKGKTVDAKSILMIMSMGLVKGTEITIVADGPDEADAVKALKELVDSKFGEE
jgi:phosphocarrier protein